MKSFITIALRLSQCQKGIIDNAAQIADKSSEAFILKCCLQDAKSILSSRTHFQLDSKERNGHAKGFGLSAKSCTVARIKKTLCCQNSVEKVKSCKFHIISLER